VHHVYTWGDRESGELALALNVNPPPRKKKARKKRERGGGEREKGKKGERDRGTEGEREREELLSIRATVDEA
jgi:hypothetical protein